MTHWALMMMKLTQRQKTKTLTQKTLWHASGRRLVVRALLVGDKCSIDRVSSFGVFIAPQIKTLLPSVCLP